jgi:transposase-like protein
MKPTPYKCPYHSNLSIEVRTTLVKYGSFYRISDRKKVQRFYCRLCSLHFSTATHSINFNQKKRQFNHKVSRLLVAGVSQREGCKILQINRKTFIRKFILMGLRAKEKLHKENNLLYPKATNIQFDDMETFEHTKCKPLSITLAVEEKSRRILDYQVSQMPAKGLLAEISRKKYGLRADHRKAARKQLFLNLQKIVLPRCIIKSDENPHYLIDVKKFFPTSEHKVYKGRKGAIVGQGELKKIGFDPIFDLNHTCATLRARMNRLFRRTWCTTKKPDRLDLHLALTALFHNRNLKPLSTA